jgi:putative transposase
MYYFNFKKDDSSFTRQSQRHVGKYDVISKELGYVCSCPDHKFRGVRCKHIQAVIISFALRKEVESHVIISPITVGNCPDCNSKDIVKHGVRPTKSGNIQRFSCKQGGKWFTHNLGFERMHATPHIIASAIQLYFSGESFRNIRRFLDLQSFKISHVAVFKWIKKYVTMMGNYLEK